MREEQPAWLEVVELRPGGLGSVQLQSLLARHAAHCPEHRRCVRERSETGLETGWLEVVVNSCPCAHDLSGYTAWASHA